MANPPSPRIYTLEKVTVAVNHLDWAMRLILDHAAFDVALTLAGAAEEVLGSLVPNSMFEEVTANLTQHSGLTRRVVTQDHLNRMRNWLKHNNSGTNEIVDAELEVEAISMIFRALGNLAQYDRSLPSEAPRFCEWLTRHYPYLLAPMRTEGESTSATPRRGRSRPG